MDATWGLVMNRLLFDTLTFLNAFIAILAIVACAFVGWNMPAFAGAKIIGLVMGGGIGLVLSAIVCGTLAYFALMERHMRTIAETVSRTQTRPAGDRDFDVRREPSI